jgi:hypothetical protein
MSQLNPESGLERALRELAPAPSTLDRDRLMYRAGQISCPQRSRAWPITTATLALMVVVLSALLVAQPAVEIREQIVYRDRPVDVPKPSPVPKPPAVDTPAEPKVPELAIEEATPDGSEFVYFRLHDQVLRWGPEALSSTSAETGPETLLAPITVDRAVGTRTAAKSPGVWNILRFFQ